MARVSHIHDYAPAGTSDEDIPGVCAMGAVDVLVSVNFRDFGAKKVLFQTLMSQGVHIAVLRPGKTRRFVPEVQIGFIAPHMPYMHHTFGAAAAGAPRLLIKLTESSAVTRSLDDLIAEFDTPRLP